MTIAVPLTVFLLAAAMPASPAGETNTDRPLPKSAVLYGFANVTDVQALPAGPVKDTCSGYAASSTPKSENRINPLTQDEAVQLAKVVTDELTKRLSKKMPVTVAQAGDVPAEGSLVITGCFVSADRGHAGARLIGLGLGASRLSAHVRLFYAGAPTPKLIDEFDVSVKGSNKLPPAGPVGLGINAVRETQATLQADARKLADNILKRWQTDEERRQTNQTKR
jgi:hypothetical protein